MDHGSLARVRRVRDLHGIDAEELWPRHEACVADAHRAALERGIRTRYDDCDVLGDLGVPLAVVSNEPQAAVEPVDDAFGLDGPFETAYGREPTIEGFRRRKPSAHYVERALGPRRRVGAVRWRQQRGRARGRPRGYRLGVRARPHRAGYGLEADPTHELESLHDLSAVC